MLWFNLTMPDPSSICDYLVWSGGIIDSAQHMTWNGCAFNIIDFTSDGLHAYGTGNPYDRSPVPVPPTLILMGFGLVGLLALRVREKKLISG